MKNIPFSFLPESLLRRITRNFKWLAEFLGRMFPFLDLSLKQAGLKFEKEEYLSLGLVSIIFNSLFLFLILVVSFFYLGADNIFLLPLGIVFIFSFCIFFSHAYYPKLLSNKRIRELEKNLMPALQDFLVQINAGIPLFDILVNIANSDYGEVSKEVKIIVDQVNAGIPQVRALEESALKNPSTFYRRAIWQIINGLKAGSDLAMVIQEAIDTLSEEQLLQIQVYGGKLSPLAMFYMLIAVIVPALGITFVVILSSFLSFSESLTKAVFFSIFGLTTFFQIMFLGMIKTRRPNLLN